MSVSVVILGESPVTLWGLTSHERLRRVFSRLGVTHCVDDLRDVPANHTVVLVRAEYLYDNRILGSLVNALPVLLTLPSEKGRIPVAAHVPFEEGPAAKAVLAGEAPVKALASVRVETPETLASAYQEQLRKFDPPFVLPIRPEHQRFLEEQLFSGSYKGITDFITKWVWPVPAQWVTRWCTRCGIQPNHVTSVGLLLVIAAGMCFYAGHFGWGLVAGWLMTFLDTVDGKLARVTVTSSKVGHVLDHGIDIIHPPLWYLVWGWGLGSTHTVLAGMSVDMIIVVIFGGYILGRLIEGAFQLWFGMFGIFCWRPFDSFSRLITARRNPNLVLLTASVLIGRPDWGLLAVAVWTVLSTLVLLLRLLMAAYVRITTGPLRSWLRDVDPDAQDESLSVRWFTRQPPMVLPAS